MTAVDVKWWGDTTDKATLSGAIPWHALKVGSGVTFCGRTVQTGAQLAGDELDGTGGALCPECLKASPNVSIKVTELQRGDLVRLDDVPHPPMYLTVLDMLDVAEGVEVRFMEGGISIYPPDGSITGVRNPGPDDNGPTE